MNILSEIAFYVSLILATAFYLIGLVLVLNHINVTYGHYVAIGTLVVYTIVHAYIIKYLKNN